MRTWRLLAFFFMLVASTAATAQNCCMPKLDEQEDSSAQLVNGIQAATVMMIIVPFALVAGIGWWYWRTARQSEDRSNAD